MKNMIFKRRSVRTYQEEQIPKEVIVQLLRAGMQAPSAHNQQPWEFIVVQRKEVLEKLSEAGPHAVMLKKAPLAIVLVANPEYFVVEPFWPQDLSAASTVMLLEAVEHGYGGCWIGVYPDEEKTSHAKEVLGLKDNKIPFAILSLGKPLKEIEPKERYKEDRVSWIE